MSPHITGPNASKATSDFTEMVGDLRRKADTNKDGSVTAAEFALFLDQLMNEAGRGADGAPAAQPAGPTEKGCRG